MSMPLHPIIVHFPISLLFLGAIIQIIALWRPKFWNQLAGFLLITGFLSGIIAYMTGDGGESFARQVMGASRSAISRHENLAFLTLLTFGIVVLIKLYQWLPYFPQLKRYAKYSQSKIFIPVLLVLSLLGGTLVFLTGHYGGSIIYQQEAQTKQVK